MNDKYELRWEESRDSTGVLRRSGWSKSTGKLVIEIKYDKEGRITEKLSYDDDGQLNKTITYQYDADRRPKMTLVYDRNGALIWRHERGKRPEDLSAQGL